MPQHASNIHGVADIHKLRKPLTIKRTLRTFNTKVVLTKNYLTIIYFYIFTSRIFLTAILLILPCIWRKKPKPSSGMLQNRIGLIVIKYF